MGELTDTGAGEAREFLGKVLALPADGEHAFIGIHNTYMPKELKKNGRLPFGMGAIASDVSAAIHQIRDITRGKSNRDVYVCMGLQQKYLEHRNPKTGEIRFRPDKHRANIVRLRSFFIDADFKGGDSGYDTQAEADVALAKFLADVGLPNPNVLVHSGNGYHIYWALDTDVLVDDWQPLATALVEATRQHGFKCDTGVTIDASRILRVPGTLNHKTDPAKTVRLVKLDPAPIPLAVMDQVLTKYKSIVTSKVGSPASSNVDTAAFDALVRGTRPLLVFQTPEEITELGAGIIAGAPPIPLRQVVPECAFIREALTTGGAHYDNHLWNLTTLLSVFTVEGEKAAHWMAHKHPGYNTDDTARLYERKEAERERSTGWPRCATIKNAGSKVCAACPHFAKGQYPFSFAHPTPPAATTPPQQPQPAVQASKRAGPDVLPPGYQRDGDGLIFRIETDNEGASTPVLPTHAVLYDPFVTTYGVAELHFTANITPNNPTIAHRRISIPYRHLFYPYTEMVNKLADHGLTIPDKKELGDFLVAWLETLKGSIAHTEYAPFGWAVDANGTVAGFSFAQTLYTPAGERVAGTGDFELDRQYSPAGDIEVWKKAAKSVTGTERPAMDAILASAFAGPLVYFTGEDGLYLNVYSDASGVFKTSAMRTAQGVWGAPDKAMFGLRDTINSVQHKMGQINNLPAYWDEVKGEKAMDFMSQMVFDLTQGKGRQRLTSQVTTREASHWKTMLVVASNNSLSDSINELAKGNDAGYYRLFELQTEPASRGVLSQAEAGAIRMSVNSNYGHAGMIYAKFLGENHGRITTDVQQVKDVFERELTITAPERYWLNTSVVLWLGAFYANMLGLTDIDLKALKGCLFDTIRAQRKTLTDEPLIPTAHMAVNILIAYLTEMQPHMLRTNTIWNHPGKPAAGVVFPASTADLMHKRGVHIQYGEQTQLLRISSEQLHDWLDRKNIKRRNFVNMLKVSVGCIYARRRICAGVDGFATPQVNVYDIDCGASKEMAGYLEAVGTTATNVVPFPGKQTP